MVIAATCCVWRARLRHKPVQIRQLNTDSVCNRSNGLCTQADSIYMLQITQNLCFSGWLAVRCGFLLPFTAKMRYFGRITRSCLEKEIIQGTLPWRRTRGRPKISWTDSIKTWTAQECFWEPRTTDYNEHRLSVMRPTLGSRMAEGKARQGTTCVGGIMFWGCPSVCRCVCVIGYVRQSRSLMNTIFHKPLEGISQKFTAVPFVMKLMSLYLPQKRKRSDCMRNVCI